MNRENKVSKMFSLARAAKITGYSQGHLNFLIRSKKLKGIKAGRNWVTSREWIEEYLQEYPNQKTGQIDKTSTAKHDLKPESQDKIHEISLDSSAWDSELPPRIHRKSGILFQDVNLLNLKNLLLKVKPRYFAISALALFLIIAGFNSDVWASQAWEKLTQIPVVGKIIEKTALKLEPISQFIAYLISNTGKKIANNQYFSHFASITVSPLSSLSQSLKSTLATTYLKLAEFLIPEYSLTSSSVPIRSSSIKQTVSQLPSTTQQQEQPPISVSERIIVQQQQSQPTNKLIITEKVTQVTQVTETIASADLTNLNEDLNNLDQEIDDLSSQIIKK